MMLHRCRVLGLRTIRSGMFPWPTFRRLRHGTSGHLHWSGHLGVTPNAAYDSCPLRFGISGHLRSRGEEDSPLVEVYHRESKQARGDSSPGGVQMFAMGTWQGQAIATTMDENNRGEALLASSLAWQASR